MSKNSAKGNQKLANLKKDCSLFGQLYIANEFRDGDLEEFFAHENHPWPPSISDCGFLLLPSKKSDLLTIITLTQQPPAPSVFDVKIFDGPAIVHSLPTNLVSTFDEYADKVFLPWTHQQLQQSLWSPWPCTLHSSRGPRTC